MKKKILSLVLALILCLALAAPALAAYDGFLIEKGALKVYGGPGGDVVIPNGVTLIWPSAFQYHTDINSVTIPDGVTFIGANAFCDCTSLTNVTIPSSVTRIGAGAFDNTPWLKTQGEFAIANGILLAYQGRGGTVTVPNSVTSIGEFAFFKCANLISVTIPNSVTEIGEFAFSNCTNLNSVTIPNSVTSIMGSAFNKCNCLTSVTIPTSVTVIGAHAFDKCARLKDVYYAGTEAQWKAIDIDNYLIGGVGGNDPLLNATIHYNSAAPDAPAVNFSDVSADAWYAAPVAWAVDKGVTNGTGSNTFSPDKTCNTAEILTFLWRACDKPQAATEGGFTDVAAGIWYADAAAWAKSKGMVSGPTLSPESPCTRASAVMFIWQAMGKPPASSPASFRDVPADSVYADAVAWAVEKGVTNGTGKDTFSPDTTCTRGHIVTFLNRAFA